MKPTSKFVLYGLAALLALAVVGRMITSAPSSAEDSDAEVLVSQMIANDPLIAPVRPR